MAAEGVELRVARAIAALNLADLAIAVINFELFSW
jgi:hypothetical protein